MMTAAVMVASLLVLGGAPQAATGVPPAQEQWTGSFVLSGFAPPDEDDYLHYLQPTVSADYGALHLEARYNYEALGAGSLFVGWNLAFGDVVGVSLTPVVGAVIGSVNGVAPGFLLGVEWKGLAFYSESEYVIDPADADNNFLYTWNELAYSPVDWLRFGFVSQRTRVFDQELTVDRGVLVGAGTERIWFEVYLFNPDADPYVGAALSLEF